MLVRKEFASASWATGETGKSIDLSVNDVLTAIELRLTGSIVIDSTADLTAVLDGGFRGIIKNIRLIADGDEYYISNVQFKEAVDRTRLLGGVDPDGGDDLAVTKSATYTCDLIARFGFRMENHGQQGGKHPWDVTTDLPAGIYTTLKLHWDWAATTEYYTVGSAGITSEAYTLHLTGLYDVDADPEKPRHRRRYIGKRHTFTGSTSADIEMFDLKGNYLVRDCFLRFRDTSAADNDVAGKIDHELTYPHSERHPYAEDFEKIQRANRDRYGIANETGCCMLLYDLDNTGAHMLQPKPTQSDIKVTTTKSTSVADASAIVDHVELNALLLQAGN